ncbi:MAG: ABC transporter permease [Nitrospirae bacterium]|nr:ABC transporter permease [Nitrospirota bacterium]
MKTKKSFITVIEPGPGRQFVDLRELKEYRDLFLSFVTRQVKVLYAQTILGFSWALIKPLFQIVVFSVIFGKVAGVSSDGIPYILFSSVAIIPWTYMSQAMTESSESLVTGHAMLGKVYFPRLVFPLTPVLSRLVDFGISMIIILGVCLYYRVSPTWNLLLFPCLTIMMMAVPAGIGLWLSSLAIRFRDVKHAMPFIIQMLIYSAPIVYSASSISEQYRIFYSLNPIVGVIEGFRACLLGAPVPWVYIIPGAVTEIIIIVSGAFYFKRMERIFADVI